MPATRPRRSSGPRVSYSYKEAFKDLEISESEAEADQESEDDEEAAAEVEEPDDFVPPEDEEDEDADEFMDDAEEEDDGQADEEDEDFTRGESIIDIASDQEISTSALTTPRRQVKGPQHSTGTLATGGARYVPLSTRGAGAAKLRQRAVEEWGVGGQESRLKNLFGPAVEDLKPVFETKNRWLSQETLPSRAHKHLARSPFVSDETREKEAKALQRWWADSGREAFAIGQQTRQLSEDEAQKYLVNHGPESINLLMGEIKDQTVYTLKKGEFMSAAAPFGSNSKRRGWILHLGSRIQDVHWAPNEEGSTQYLAVAVEQKNTSGKRHKYLENPKAPAFAATNPFPASIQIWSFESTANGSLDPVKEPRLAQVICTDWGAPKSIRWWPIEVEESARQPDDGVVRLGLLSGIWSDGRVRVLEVSHRTSAAGSPQTQYVHYTKAALELRFPDTIPSCLCWLSPTSIAVGTASGMVAIWTLSRPYTLPSPTSTPQNAAKHNPQPWFYKQVSDTYIITLTSASPSSPHLVSVTTADGFALLVDVRTPLADAVASPRGRMLILTQAWHEHTQSFVMPDEYYMLRHSSARRYYQSIYSFRVGSSITTVATSKLHPGVLLGTSDGEIVCTNGLCKMLNSKEIPWSQIWFKHEWRRAQASPSDAAAESNVSTGAQDEAEPRSGPEAYAGQPLVRITEGYKPTQTGMQYPDSTKRYKEGAKFITIFEENSAVTRMGWNPNLKFGTWAVAGMQSGIVRVEDLGV
ncbi:hypothetical protein N0V90_000542 [Kalmusia sp. IMI 367209]|nr:hypothetical protein N0V90_000542 [Kalmusia sp. IMI 367209]